MDEKKSLTEDGELKVKKTAPAAVKKATQAAAAKKTTGSAAEKKSVTSAAGGDGARPEPAVKKATQAAAAKKTTGSAAAKKTAGSTAEKKPEAVKPDGGAAVKKVKAVKAETAEKTDAAGSTAERDITNAPAAGNSVIASETTGINHTEEPVNHTEETPEVKHTETAANIQEPDTAGSELRPVNMQEEPDNAVQGAKPDNAGQDAEVSAAEIEPAQNKPEVTLKLIDLTKKYGDRTSVDKVNLEVYAGEVFGFLGPNGAGKTTTIRMITGLASITSGEVLICGKSMKSDFKGALKNIGGIIENPEMYKYMSGWDNLKYYASLYDGITDAQIMDAVKLVRMENRIHEKVRRYSLGMRQRVGIAQSLLHNPKLLLLDEPTNGLDPKGIHEMRDFLKMLAHERGFSVFISSHILTEMQLMCDRVAIISKGKCIAIKSVNEWTQEGETKKVKLTVPNPSRAAGLIKEKFNVEIEINGNLLIFTIDDSKIADISLLLAAERIPVLSLIVGEKSLEETFLELTSQDNMIID